MHLRILLLGVAAVSGVAAMGKVLWDTRRADAQRVLAINNTRFFQWQDGAGGALTLTVKPNPRLLHTVTAPPVPVSGDVAIVAKPGATQPGAVVQITNPRTGKVVGAYADASGAFSLTLAAEAGDDLRILAMPPPRIEEPPEPAYVGLGQ